jgi:DNA-directed RNA polymerase subunit F
MIKEMQPLSLPEVKKTLENVEDNEKKTQFEAFLKKFSKISLKKASELKKELEELNLIKLKEEHIVKIIDLMPEDANDLNKIFTDVSLDEDETNKVLELVKKYK